MKDCDHRGARGGRRRAAAQMLAIGMAGGGMAGAGATSAPTDLPASGGAGASASAPAPPAGAPFRFGDYRGTIGDLRDPADVAIGPGGVIYVAESGRDRISVFDATGAPLRVVDGGMSGGGGDGGADPGGLATPGGVAVGADGTLFVADTGNDRIRVFDAAGRPLRAWGGHGREPGRFNEPRGLVWDGEHLLVADLGNQRVQVFDAEGTFVRAFGRPGGGEGELNGPADVAVDDAGFVYVADADNNRIEKFDGVGRFVKAWGDWGPFTGLLDDPGSLAFRGGELLVADTRNHRFQVFDPEGAPLEQWGAHALQLHQGEGRLHYPSAVAIAPDGSFAVVCEGFENRCQIFDARPEGAPPPAPTRIPSTPLKAHFGEQVDVDGTLLAIAEPEAHRVYVFETSHDIPIVIGDFGERGTRFGQMIRIAGLDLHVSPPSLLVCDTATRRLQLFQIDYDPEAPRAYDPRRARFAQAYDLAAIAAEAGASGGETGARGGGLIWPVEPGAVEHDGDGNLYVTDARNARVLVFDASMRFVRSWGGYGTERGRLRRPTDVALSRDGETVFVVDSGNHRIQAFDREGRFQRAWGERGDGDGAFRQPFGIAAGRDGFVYVTDDAANRVQKFTEEGAYVTQWGRLGVGNGELWKPKGIAQGDRLRVIVVDYGNHRAQIFSPDGEWLVTFGRGRAFTKWDGKSSDEATKRRSDGGGRKSDGATKRGSDGGAE